MTLSEVLIAMGISGILVSVLVSVMLYCSRSMAGLANYLDLNAKSVRAMDQMSSDIRQCAGLTYYRQDELVFNDGTNAFGLIFTYDPFSRSLIRHQGGRHTVLLTECDPPKFTIYQRTPMAGTYDQYPPAIATDCKVVSIKFSCSRTLLGLKATTESDQEARIVMRTH